MKFSVRGTVSCSRARLGALHICSGENPCEYDTPACILSTQTGSVPNLTQDVVSILLQSFHARKETSTHTPLLSVPVQHFAHIPQVLQKHGKGVASLAALPNHDVISTVQCALSSTPSGYNDSLSVSSWTSSGRVPLKPAKYMNIVSSLKCAAWEALHDADTSADCSNKRIVKSFRNSFSFVSSCLSETKNHKELGPVLLPLLGGWHVTQRKKWTKELHEMLEEEYADHVDDIGGYTLQGVHSNGISAEKVLPSDQLMQCVQASLDGTKEGLARIAPGSFPPTSVLSLIQAGIDVFDSSLATVAADRGCALNFPYTQQMLRDRHSSPVLNSPQTSSEKSSISNTGDGKAAKKFKPDRDSALPIAAADENDSEESNSDTVEHDYEINIMDKRFAGSKDVLLPGCGCYTCSLGYTRGYIHHLSATKELLAPLLLTLHNLHHWLGFFAVIRKAVEQDALQELVTIVSSANQNTN